MVAEEGVGSDAPDLTMGFMEIFDKKGTFATVGSLGDHPDHLSVLGPVEVLGEETLTISIIDPDLVLVPDPVLSADDPMDSQDFAVDQDPGLDGQDP